MFHSLKTRLCLLIFLTLALVAGLVLFFTHRDVVTAMSAAEERSAGNVLDLAELGLRSGYRNLLQSRVDAVRAHRRTLEGMALVAESGLDAVFLAARNAGLPTHEAKEQARQWLNSLETTAGSEFLLFDRQGLLLAHSDQAVRGQRLDEVQDSKGIPLAEAVWAEATQQGEAAATFLWTLNPSLPPAKKFGWFTSYPAMGWIIGASADLEELEVEGARKRAELLANLQSNFATIRIARTGSLFLFDQEGRMLIEPAAGESGLLASRHPESGKGLLTELQELAAGKSRQSLRIDLPYPAPDGPPRTRELFCVQLKSLGWYLGAIAYVDEIHAPARELVARLSLVFVAVFLFSLTIALWFSLRMTRPLNTLAAYAKALPETDFSAAAVPGAGIADLPDRRRDEVGRLAGALIFMEGSLRENIRHLIATTASKERMEGELGVAREIQLGLLPKTLPPFPNRPEFDLHAMLEAAREVGGDLYDFFFLDERFFCFAVGDVSGKGVPASLFMAISRTLLRSAAARDRDPASIMTTMNNDLAASNPSSMFVTLFVGILDLQSGRLLYANGGHNPAVLLGKGAPPTFMTARSGPLVGAMEDIDYRVLEMQLAPGDTLFLYTDGVTEAMDTGDHLYSDPRLLAILADQYGREPQAVVEVVAEDVARHVGDAEPSDDITMLCLRFHGSGKDGPPGH